MTTTETRIYAGSNPERQSQGLPGHCEGCAARGHEAVHPQLGCADVGCDAPHQPGYMQSFESYWRDIVCDPDGSLNLDKVARELADALTLQGHLTEVYLAVSGEAVSKPFTLPSVVIGLYHQQLMDAADEAVRDLIKSIEDAGTGPLASAAEVVALIRDVTGVAAAP